MAGETKTAPTKGPSSASKEPFAPATPKKRKTADQIRKENLESSEAPQVDKADLDDKRRPASPFRADVKKLVAARDKTDKDGNVVMGDEERAYVNALEHANEQYEEFKRVEAKRNASSKD
jgi:hypothetical protein